jgi:hypothetical protein
LALECLPVVEKFSSHFSVAGEFSSLFLVVAKTVEYTGYIKLLIYIGEYNGG